MTLAVCSPPSFCETPFLTEPGGHHFQLGWPATEAPQVPSSSMDSGGSNLGPHADLCSQPLGSFSLLSPIEDSLRPHGDLGTRILGHREGCPSWPALWSQVFALFTHPCGHSGPVVICAGAMACSALDLGAYSVPCSWMEVASDHRGTEGKVGDMQPLFLG